MRDKAQRGRTATQPPICPQITQITRIIFYNLFCLRGLRDDSSRGCNDLMIRSRFISLRNVLSINLIGGDSYEPRIVFNGKAMAEN
jgi:Cu/Ag efflux pump CusA